MRRTLLVVTLAGAATFATAGPAAASSCVGFSGVTISGSGGVTVHPFWVHPSDCFIPD